MSEKNCGNCTDKCEDVRMYYNCPVFLPIEDSIDAKEPELPEKFVVGEHWIDITDKLNQMRDYLKARDGK